MALNLEFVDVVNEGYIFALIGDEKSKMELTTYIISGTLNLKEILPHA